MRQEKLNYLPVSLTPQATDKYTHLEVRAYYNKGGYNYFTGQLEKRGYYVQVTPVIKEEHEYGSSVSYTCFTGYKHLVEKCNRFSEKAFDAACQSEGARWSINQIAGRVLAEQKIELVGELPTKFF